MSPPDPASPARPRLAVLTNMLAPYRIPIFRHLSHQFDVTVLCSGRESNRRDWGMAAAGEPFSVEHLPGLTVPWTKRAGGAPVDIRYLHLNPSLLGALRRLAPDAVLSDEMGFRSLAALHYGRCSGRPVWIWWGGTRHTERSIGILRRLVRRWFARHVSRWLSYGATSTDYLESLGVDRSRIVQLQNCVPEELYLRPAEPAHTVVPRPVLLCVGRLVPGKGVDLLLRSAARLSGETPFSILVVGDGPERPALVRLARDLGLHNVVFRPASPADAMSAVYRSADALVFPTLDDVWGLVVNEALWSGLPAVVSRYAGCAVELVPPDCIFDPLDAEGFTAVLRRVVAGTLPPPDRSRLRPIEDVSEQIACAVWETIGGSGAGSARP